MRRLLFTAALLLPGCRPAAPTTPTTTVDVGPSEAPPPSAPRVLVWDFTRPPARATGDPAAALLRRLYPRFLPDLGACTAGVGDYQGDLGAARAAGQFAPRVTSQFAGAFTAPGARETAVLVARSECNATHADLYGTRELVVFAGTAPRLRVAVDDGAIELVRDLDGDGTDELLLTAGDTHMGYTETHATLVSLRGGALATRQNVGLVYEDACGTGEPGSEVEAARLWYAAGHLERETIVRPCAPEH